MSRSEGQPFLEELQVALVLDAGGLVVGLDRGSLGQALQALRLELDLEIAIVRLLDGQVPLRRLRGELEVRVAELQNNCLGFDGCSRQQDDLLDTARRTSRNRPDLLRNQRARPAPLQ